MKAKYGMQDGDIYNFDETGFIIGMIRILTVIMRANRVRKPKAVQPGNREWAIAIVCVNGNGYAIPPFLVVQGCNHLANWYTQANLSDDWIIRTTFNG